MVSDGMCGRYWRVARLCRGQLDLFRRPPGATTRGSSDRVSGPPDLGTLSGAMPAELAVLSLGLGIVAIAVAALVDPLAREHH